MPRYVWSESRMEPGAEMAPPEFRPCRVFDADGCEVAVPAFLVDTDTGEVQYYIRDSQGQFRLDDSGREILTATFWASPPLTLVSRDPDEAAA